MSLCLYTMYKHIAVVFGPITYHIYVFPFSLWSWSVILIGFSILKANERDNTPY